MKFGPNGMKQLTASTFIAHITKTNRRNLSILLYLSQHNTVEMGRIRYLVQVVHNRSEKANKEKKK